MKRRVSKLNIGTSMCSAFIYLIEVILELYIFQALTVRHK